MKYFEFKQKASAQRANGVKKQSRRQFLDTTKENNDKFGKRGSVAESRSEGSW
jgi:hypothetical protein